MKDLRLNRKVELLAPAGSYDAFLAAVENGADAVYLGGKLLNARQFAGNFDNEELKRALDYAHTRGVKVILTLNTLVLDTEMLEALEYAGNVYEMGVDAFILQDVGLASNLKKAIPQLPIHASTQMTIYNNDGVKALESMGFSRAVLARELTLHEIKNICTNTDMEIEVFAHGALCICYSGQCLMSSMIGGRSGNRGKCAQPCRLPYSISKDGRNAGNGHLLSPKDICFIDQLADLIDAGVSSLKIEGRMKSPEYVAAVVSIYRKYLNEIEQNKNYNNAKGFSEKNNIKASEEDMNRLLQSFNRGGFSKGYLLGKTGPEMMSYQKPKNWGTYLGRVLDQDIITKSIKIKLDNTLGNGDGIEIWSNRLHEESPGGIITKIVKDGKLIKRAQKGDIVWVSYIKDSVQKDSKVYKTSDKELLESYTASSTKGIRKTDIKASFTLKSEQFPVLFLEDADGISVLVTGEVLPQKALNKPLTHERIREQLMKMGSTPFNIIKLDVDMDDDIVIPVSELNTIRRKAADLLEKKRILSTERKINTQNGEIYKSLLHFPGNRNHGNKNVKISAILYSIPDNIELRRINADRLYLPYTSLIKDNIINSINELRNEGMEIVAYIPAIIRGNYSQLIEKNIDNVLKNADGFLVGNLGVLQTLKQKLNSRNCSKKLIGDHTLNLLNNSSLCSFKEMGLRGAMLSFELNLSQIDNISIPDDFDAELGVYGRIPVMTSEYCPVGGSIGKNSPKECKTLCKSGKYHLKDRKGAEFLVTCDCTDCRSTIFNSNVLFIPDLLQHIVGTGIDYLRLSFVDESAEEIYDIVDLHRDIIGKGIYLNKDNEEIMERIKEKGFTKGHLQRGV